MLIEHGLVPIVRHLPDHANPYFHQLACEVTTLAAHINSAQCEWLLVVAEFDRIEAWKIDGGIANTADWLAWKCRLSKGTAREKVRVARALLELPKIRDAFSTGELSYSMVRELTRVATPAREASLLNVCRHGTSSHVTRLVRHVRRIDVQADPEASLEAFEQRSASWWTRDDGTVEVRAVLTPDQGRTVVAALEALVAHIKNETHTQEECPVAQQRADAVERLAELGLRSDQVVKHCDANASTKSRITGGDLHTLNINAEVEHVDLDQLVPQLPTHDAERVPRGTLARLSCDCALVATINDADGKPLGVGRKTRVVPSALRRALEGRDLGCTFPGCSHHRHVDAHHIMHWASGGKTELENLTLLCRRHHRLVHEGGFTVRMDTDGYPAFSTPDGRRVEPEPIAHVPAGTLVKRNGERGVDVDHTTTHTRWDGRRPHWGMMVDGVLMYQ